MQQEPHENDGCAKTGPQFSAPDCDVDLLAVFSWLCFTCQPRTYLMAAPSIPIPTRTQHGCGQSHCNSLVSRGSFSRSVELCDVNVPLTTKTMIFVGSCSK